MGLERNRLQSYKVATLLPQHRPATAAQPRLIPTPSPNRFKTISKPHAHGFEWRSKPDDVQQKIADVPKESPT